MKHAALKLLIAIAGSAFVAAEGLVVRADNPIPNQYIVVLQSELE